MPTAIRKTLRTIGAVLLGLLLAGATVWSALVIYFSDLPSQPLRLGLAAAFGLCALASFLLLRKARALLVFAAAFAAVLASWLWIEPSNERAWQSEVAVLPYATRDGDVVILHKVRSFDYRTEQDFDVRYDDRTLDLGRLNAVDLIAVYWAGDAIAHIMVSFGFGDQYVTFSIETRKEKGEAYSSIAGFFRRYELIYVVGDERDLIRVRTNYRRPEEQVYLYRTRAGPQVARRLFLQYVDRINELRERPEFYNTLTTNCTTDVWLLARTLSGRFPLDWRVLLSGHFPEYAYDLGSLDTSMPFPELKSISLINDKAHAADRAPDFSRRIRKGLPRPPTRSEGEHGAHPEPSPRPTSENSTTTERAAAR